MKERRLALVLGAAVALTLLAPATAGAVEGHGNSHERADVQATPTAGHSSEHEQHPAAPAGGGDEPAAEGHDMENMVDEAEAEAKDRPRLLVLGGFTGVNVLVLAAAVLVRRRDRLAPDRRSAAD